MSDLQVVAAVVSPHTKLARKYHQHIDGEYYADLFLFLHTEINTQAVNKINKTANYQAILWPVIHKANLFHLIIRR